MWSTHHRLSSIRQVLTDFFLRDLRNPKNPLRHAVSRRRFEGRVDGWCRPFQHPNEARRSPAGVPENRFAQQRPDGRFRGRRRIAIVPQSDMNYVVIQCITETSEVLSGDRYQWSARISARGLAVAGANDHPRFNSGARHGSGPSCRLQRLRQKWASPSLSRGSRKSTENSGLALRLYGVYVHCDVGYSLTR